MADIGQLWQLLKGAMSNEASRYGNSPRLADLLMRDKSTQGIRDYAGNVQQRGATLAGLLQGREPTDAQKALFSGLDPTTDEGAMNFALTFAGPMAKTANLAKLRVAEQMKAQGIPDAQIHKDTGWFFGMADGKPRFEIPDNGSTMQGGKLPSTYIKGHGDVENWRVGDVLNHPQLHDAYPSTTEIESSFMNNGRANAEYKPGLDWISYSSDHKLPILSAGQKAKIAEARAQLNAFTNDSAYKDYHSITDKLLDQPQSVFDEAFYRLGGPGIEAKTSSLAGNINDLMNKFRSNPEGGNALGNAFGSNVHSVTLHELQHAIQHREGFAQGGSPEQFKNALPNETALNDAQIIAARIAKGETPSQAAKWLQNNLGRSADPQVMDLAMKKDIFSQTSDPYEAYRRLAGEAEARLTQSRMNMTPEQRATSYPPSMFDVPVEQQIVRYK